MSPWLALPLALLAAAAPAQQGRPPVEAVVPSAIGAAEPPATPKPAEPDPPSLADQLSFGVNGPRMTVPVRIAGAGPYDFIIDTGAQRTVISRELAGRLGLARGRTIRMMAMTGAAEVGTVTIPSLSVSSVGAGRIEAPLLEGRDLGAPGMLGIDTLQGHAVRIDFDARTMAVSPSKRRATLERAAPDEIVIRARSLLGQLVVTDALCDGQRVRVILDTGSVVSMGNLALRRKLARKNPGKPIELISVTGGVLGANYSTIDRITLGGLTINALPMAFADAPPFREFGLDKRPAILLGMDALKLFRRVHIDFANREVRLLAPRGALLRG